MSGEGDLGVTGCSWLMFLWPGSVALARANPPTLDSETTYGDRRVGGLLRRDKRLHRLRYPRKRASQGRKERNPVVKGHQAR